VNKSNPSADLMAHSPADDGTVEDDRARPEGPDDALDEGPPPPPFQGGPARLDEPRAGARFEPFELIRLLGRGSLGPVYLGRDTRLGRPVAVKLLKSPSAELTQRFFLEARTVAALEHENIAVTTASQVTWAGGPVVATELLTGRPLSQLTRDGRALSPPRVLELVVPVVRALAHAHARGVLHRNLKPSNVFLCDHGAIKVLDLGIASVFKNDEQAPTLVARMRPRVAADAGSLDELTQRAALAATLASLAPEQWAGGTTTIDHRADLWAVGVLLSLLLTGRHPLEGQRLELVATLDAPMPRLTARPPGLSAQLAAVVDRCLMKRREQRWPDATSLLDALTPFLPGPRRSLEPHDRPPYVGLAAFQEQDAPLFFGRSAEIAAVASRVRELPVLAVAGHQGTGKSSLLRAGLIPWLKSSGEPWDALVMRPGRNPLGALASLVAPLLTASASGASSTPESPKLARRFAAEPGFAGVVLRARAKQDQTSLLCVVDQLEELFTLATDATERRAFIEALLGLADDPSSPVRLAVTIRSDFLDRCADEPRLMARLAEGLFFLGPPTRATVREAIVGPAQLLGLPFESPSIVDDMVAQAEGRRGALALVQVSARRLWEARDVDTGRLTEAAYRATGGLTGALGQFADEGLATLPPEARPLARAILLRLVTSERSGAPATLLELKELHAEPGELTTVVDALLKAGLLRMRPGTRTPTVELAHQSLTDTWPLLQGWLEERASDATFVEQLRRDAAAWDAEGRRRASLWRGTAAEEAQRFADRYRGTLSDAQREFLLAVVANRRAEGHRRRTARVGALVLLGAVTLASLVGLLILRQDRDDAQAQARAALVAESQARQRQEASEQRERDAARATATVAQPTDQPTHQPFAEPVQGPQIPPPPTLPPRYTSSAGPPPPSPPAPWAPLPWSALPSSSLLSSPPSPPPAPPPEEVRATAERPSRPSAPVDAKVPPPSPPVPTTGSVIETLK
jgi:serine/threonine protein kinase